VNGIKFVTKCAAWVKAERAETQGLVESTEHKIEVEDAIEEEEDLGSRVKGRDYFTVQGMGSFSQ
jgi:hypothetical protein